MIVKEPDNFCVVCGAVIPEGRQVCPICGTSMDESLHIAVEDLYAAYCEQKHEIERLQQEVERLKRERLQLLNAISFHGEEEYTD